MFNPYTCVLNFNLVILNLFCLNVDVPTLIFVHLPNYLSKWNVGIIIKDINKKTQNWYFGPMT